jgi:hypothetical protein
VNNPLLKKALTHVTVIDGDGTSIRIDLPDEENTIVQELKGFIQDLVRTPVESQWLSHYGKLWENIT